MDRQLTEMRKRIDAAHSEALQALATIAKFLKDSSDSAAQATPDENGVHRIVRNRARGGRRARGGATKREIILNSIRESYKSVADIAEDTGLSKPMVRTVVYEKKMAHKISRRDTKGILEFKAKTESGA
jgi:hypothetical protein